MDCNTFALFKAGTNIGTASYKSHKSIIKQTINYPTYTRLRLIQGSTTSMSLDQHRSKRIVQTTRHKQNFTTKSSSLKRSKARGLATGTRPTRPERKEMCYQKWGRHSEGWLGQAQGSNKGRTDSRGCSTGSAPGPVEWAGHRLST
jgi:hypothetical protein